MKHVDETPLICFPVVITVKNEKSVHIALDSKNNKRKLYTFQNTHAEHRELPNQFSIDIMRD